MKNRAFSDGLWLWVWLGGGVSKRTFGRLRD